MSLQVWLPLDNHLQNHGLSSVKFSGSNVTYSQGKIGKCANGTINGAAADLESSTGFTLGLWMKMDSTIKNQMIVSIPIYNGVKNSNLILYKMDYNAIKVHTTNNDPQMIWSYDSTSSGKWTPGKWFHYVVQVENSATNLIVKTFINGKYEQTYTSADYNFTLIPGTITLSGNVFKNDFRLYNHRLTVKEIEEWSKGLFLHYPLRDMEIENTTNLLPYPTPKGINNSAWTASLHPNAINVNGFSNGYNAGVSDPSIGYHAYWAVIDDEPTMVFPDLNTEYGKSHRWLGISTSGIDNLTNTIGINNQYTLSFEAKSSVDNKAINCGLYYQKIGATSKDFHDGKKNFYLTTNWRKYSYTWTLGSNADTSVGGSFYFYGNVGSLEAISYIRNVQLEVKSHATGYTNGARISSMIDDCSGFQHHGTITGTIDISPDSSRHTHCIYQDDGRYNYIGSDNIYFPTDEITMSCWVKGNSAGYTNYHIPLSFNAGYYEMSLEGTNGTFRGGFYVNGTRQCTTSAASSGTTLDGKWHFIVITYNGNVIRKYLDGMLSKEDSAPGALAGGTGKLLIGNYNGTQYGNKQLYTSDVRVYATALSEADIKELYKLGASVDKNGLFYGYEFIENDLNSVTKAGVVDFSNFIEYNINESRKEKISIYKNSIDASNLYEF